MNCAFVLASHRYLLTTIQHQDGYACRDADIWDPIQRRDRACIRHCYRVSLLLRGASPFGQVASLRAIN